MSYITKIVFFGDMRLEKNTSAVREQSEMRMTEPPIRPKKVFSGERDSAAEG